MRRRFLLLLLALPASRGAAEPPLSFNRDIRPILSDNCFYCHGQDPNKRKADLRLDQAESARKPAESGEIAIVPGKPGESALVARIFSDDPDEHMPPAKSHHSLTAPQKETLRRWVAEGGAYEPHWAYVAPVRPALPPVREAAWPKNDLDRFVLARLEREGLAPSPEADRPTLLRRVSLDLTGLPPTPEEIDAFLADPASDAY